MPEQIILEILLHKDYSVIDTQLHGDATKLALSQ